MPYFALLFPAPGATNVPDNTNQLLFGGTLYAGTPASSVVVNANGQTVATITTFSNAEFILVPVIVGSTPSPLPSGPYLSGALPTLSAHTAYTVRYEYTQSASGVCGGLQTETLGTFTTQ